MCVCIEFFFNLLEAIHILFVTILKAIEPFITRPKFDNIYFARLVQSEKRLFETKYFVRILNYSVEKNVICLMIIRICISLNLQTSVLNIDNCEYLN